MPTYDYAVIKPDGSLGERFEVFQSMSDAPLTTHPETGEPVKRLVSAPGLALKHSDANDKSKLSDANLDRLGFTKYQRSGDNTWDKTAGSGPDSITRD
ncbi:MAG: zinc ribbon domain-containing protein [Planctomycetota bacterium]|nr:zinc ribbon domain-containing protein [Planctomycetota bacterium]MEE2894810.1 zinc ribbon domain-containing protein [Planctomycetota bacterium]